jgi:hypothetical protein
VEVELLALTCARVQLTRSKGCKGQEAYRQCMGERPFMKFGFKQADHWAVGSLPSVVICGDMGHDERL